MKTAMQDRIYRSKFGSQLNASRFFYPTTEQTVNWPVLSLALFITIQSNRTAGVGACMLECYSKI